MSEKSKLSSSFRDPSGFVFEKDGDLYRQVNSAYKENYERLMTSGLYAKLSEDRLMVRHEEASLEFETVNGDSESRDDTLRYKVIRPERIPFISYPYEWCFSQLKDAALLTLSIEKAALAHGMSLKDASAYNVQFLKGKPIFIDTLSFEPYEEGQPWVAYKQFCQHFLAPLSLMANRDSRMNQLMSTNIDGIPLDLAANLLPRSTWLNFGLAVHIHIHAKSQQKYSKEKVSEAVSEGKMSKAALSAFLDNLESLVKSLKLKNQETFWKNYYQEHNYTDTAFKAKQSLVKEFIENSSPKLVFDLGANTGIFSRITAESGALTISTDLDSQAVEANYLKAKEKKEPNILPLILDLSAPSPAIGWNNKERMSFTERGPADLLLALAVIHHLALGNNVPLESIAQFFASLGRNLIIEFVPKSDSQVEEMLSLREDVFEDYHQDEFERAFSECFVIERRLPVAQSERTLYLMRHKEEAKLELADPIDSIDVGTGRSSRL